ncbi:circadian-associated transcriptional repressor isoform X2 [Dromaius novaehollandiae]|uniref:circadian-associated transcriptional repressor isoform X2 n=1 Tax=Dromaius novaehollandiae TaxID=8790 RepID=UPI00311FA661
MGPPAAPGSPSPGSRRHLPPHRGKGEATGKRGFFPGFFYFKASYTVPAASPRGGCRPCAGSAGRGGGLEPGPALHRGRAGGKNVDLGVFLPFFPPPSVAFRAGTVGAMDPPGSDNDLGAFPSDGDGHVGARRGPPAATATTPPPPRPPRRRRRPPERSRKRAVAGGCPERAVPHGAKRQRGGTAEPADSLDPPSADGDRLFAQKCRELQGFIRPLAELLQGLRAGRYEKGLSTFQQSVAMDRIQRIIGVLQKPEMGWR